MVTPGGLESLIAAHRAEVCFGTPTLLRLLDSDRVPTLTRVVTGGEVLPPDLARRWAPDRRCFNVYGPSEGTVLTTAQRCTGAEFVSVPLGRPLAGRGVLVVDDELRPVAPGELGEICLGGLALARGYWQRAELTDERFITLSPSGRWYRTGDLGRLASDGTLHFVGRVDRQVKIRGHRIELEEIESALMCLSGVAEAAVTTLEANGGTRLVAHVVGTSGTPPSEDQLRAGLARRLPRYMIPHLFATAEALPHTSNGKVATDGLRPPRSTLASNGIDAGGLDRLLLGIFRRVLAREDISAEDDFFDVGGDSLDAVQVLAAATDAGVTIPPATFYAERSVKRVAEALRAGGTTVQQPDEP